MVNYKETDKDTPHDLEKYLEEVLKEHEQRWALPSCNQCQLEQKDLAVGASFTHTL